jgi:hypothetical protein
MLRKGGVPRGAPPRGRDRMDLDRRFLRCSPTGCGSSPHFSARTVTTFFASKESTSVVTTRGPGTTKSRCAALPSADARALASTAILSKRSDIKLDLLVADAEGIALGLGLFRGFGGSFPTDFDRQIAWVQQG